MESAEQVKSYIATHRLSFPHVLDADGKLASWFGVRGTPMTFLVNRSGHVVGQLANTDRFHRRQVRIEIKVPPEFPAKYRTALVRAADKCSVKRMLDAPPAIETRVTVEE